MDIFSAIAFLGGLAFFLYGMSMLGDGLSRASGGKMEKILEKLTNSRFKAVLLGAGVTAVIQSSSATTVMVVGFVNAGIMKLTQAVGLIMGANIGTTVTAWLVSLSEWGSVLKPEFLAPLVVGIGAFMLLFARSEKKIKIGEILTGFGVLFIGLTFMSNAITPYKDAPIFADAFRVLGRNPLLAVLAGAVVTAIIQSSSASVGILQTLAMNGVVNWQSAIFITLGQNIGTCVTALISSAGTGKNAKRASIIHLMFNVIGSIWVGIVMFFFFRFQRELAASTINSVEISIFHTIFNVTNTVVLFPFANGLVRLSKVLIPDEETEDMSISAQAARRLDHRMLNNPSLALEAAVSETLFMGKLALSNLKAAMSAVMESNKETIKQVQQTEQEINQLETLLTAFLVEVDNLSLTEKQHLTVKNLFYTVSDIERVGDHGENIAELAEMKRKDKIKFSEKGEKDLNKMYDAALRTLEYAMEARKTENRKTALLALEAEEAVDGIEKELRDKHIQRLSKGKCAPESGVIFLDILSNLERIADHADNIAGYVATESKSVVQS